MKRYVCPVCGYVYDGAKGARDAAPGTAWADVPDQWKCPRCGAAKVKFAPEEPAAPGDKAAVRSAEESMTDGARSALCSNLARGCGKQYLPEEAALFTELAEFFAAAAGPAGGADPAALLARVQEDLESGLPAAKAAAEAAGDRGAQRALVWAEKVTRIQRSLLTRYQKQGDELLKDKNVYVCTICGFIAVADAPPALCPVCKAPDWQFAKVEGR